MRRRKNQRSSMRIIKFVVCIVFLLPWSTYSAMIPVKVFGLRGHWIELEGEHSTAHRVLWRYNMDKAVEFDKSEEPNPVEYFSMFKAGTTLNTHTWSLNISGLEASFDGIYLLQINHMDTAKHFQLSVLDAVSKPTIGHECEASRCNLTCQGVDSPHTVCTWTGSGGGGASGTVWQVEVGEDQDHIYTCNFSNPVSWSSASIKASTLFHKQGYEEIIIAVVIVVLLLGFSVGFGICRRSSQRKGRGRMTGQDGQAGSSTAVCYDPCSGGYANGRDLVSMTGFQSTSGDGRGRENGLAGPSTPEAAEAEPLATTLDPEQQAPEA